MSDNIYQAPSAKIENKTESNGSIIKGALWGSLTDIVASTALGFVFGVVYMIILVSDGLSEEEIVNALSEFDLTSPFGLTATILGLSISFFAGYIGAKKSGGNILIVAGIICVSSNLFALAMSDGLYTVTENAILTMLTVAAILGGAMFWSSQADKSTISKRNNEE